MAGGHDWTTQGELYSGENPVGTVLNLANMDVTCKTPTSSRTITGPGGGFAPSTIQVPIDANWLAADGWIFANNTSVSLTITAISVIYTTASTAANGSLDFYRVFVGVVSTITGVPLTVSPVLVGTTGVANTLYAPTLTAVLSDRILLPSQKISASVINGPLTNLNGCLVTINFRS